MRAVADFGRPLRSFGHVEDVLRRQSGAGDLLDRLVEPLPVVGEIDRQRRRPGRDDAEHVAFVNQLLRDLLEQLADAAGIAEVQMEIVDEDQEDAARRVGRRTRRRQDDALLRRARGGGAAML